MKPCTSSSSHELPMESRAKVAPCSGKHSIYTHFPKDPNCDICLKTKITRASCRRAGTVVPKADLVISRHPRRVYSESCAFDYASVTFKESDGYVTVLTGRGQQCECFCRVVPLKGQRLKDLEHFLAVVRARYSSLQVRS